MSCSISCPLQVEQLKQIEIPSMLRYMLAWVICSDIINYQEERALVPEKVHWQIMAIGQDLIYCATHGRVRTPKHIVHPMTVRPIQAHQT